MLFGFLGERRLCEGRVKPVVDFDFEAWCKERMGVVRIVGRAVRGKRSAPRGMVVRNIFGGRWCD